MTSPLKRAQRETDEDPEALFDCIGMLRTERAELQRLVDALLVADDLHNTALIYRWDERRKEIDEELEAIKNDIVNLVVVTVNLDRAERGSDYF